MKLTKWLLLLIVLPVAANAVTSKVMNPDISVNFLGLYKYASYPVPDSGPSLQEVEAQFMSDVDPYFRANALLSMSRPPGAADYGLDPEEVFLETISLPGVTVKAGKFKAAFGRHNTLHTHAFPFIDQPLINTILLGNEGLNEVGASAAALIPVSWFSEVTLQALRGENNILFNPTSHYEAVGLVHFKNLWDVSDSSTIEFGLSGATGRNQWMGRSNLFGADFTYKWRPTAGGKYHAFVFSTEYLMGDEQRRLPTGTSEGGIASWVQYQFAERWWAQYRAEFVGIPLASDMKRENKQSVLLAFAPSEFSAFRIQYALLNDGTDTLKHEVQFQLNVTIGAHPAHSY